MFQSFDEKAFWQAIDEKDWLRLKVNTVSAIRNDPTFARGETEQVLKVLHDRVPDIFEDKITLDYEEYLDPSEWNKRYFTKLTCWFQDNFSEKRLDYIKEVGRVVHKDTAEKYEASLKIGSTQPEEAVKRTEKQARSHASGNTQGKRHTVNPTQAPAARKRKFSVAGVIAAAAAVLVLVVVLLVKLFNR